jgi:hypothetical protein
MIATAMRIEVGDRREGPAGHGEQSAAHENRVEPKHPGWNRL